MVLSDENEWVTLMIINLHAKSDFEKGDVGPRRRA
jgi:hypothetical protein